MRGNIGYTGQLGQFEKLLEQKPEEVWVLFQETQVPDKTPESPKEGSEIVAIGEEEWVRSFANDLGKISARACDRQITEVVQKMTLGDLLDLRRDQPQLFPDLG